jgi:hypothetical protein
MPSEVTKHGPLRPLERGPLKNIERVVAESLTDITLMVFKFIN